MKSTHASQKSRAIRFLWLLEVVIIVIAVLGSAWLRFLNDQQTHLEFIEDAPARALLVAVCLTGAMAAFGLYQVHMRHSRMDFFLRFLMSFVLGGIALVVLYYLVPQAYIGRGVLALSLLISAAGIVAVRMLSVSLFRTDVLKQRILVLGAGNNADLINSRMRRKADRRSFLVVGFVPVAGQPVVVRDELLVKPPGTLADLVEELQIDELVIAPDERRGGLPMEDMLQCVQHGVNVIDLSTFFEREAGMVQLNIVDPSWLVFSGGFDYSTPRRLSKRFFDLLAAGALLVLAWPLMLLTALAVWAESGGPILYSQIRVGERGNHFKLTKFRSMRTDAEKGGVAVWASKDDDRTTRVGRFIRKTRLDELPQLFAVLRGDMSFVGPRPERPQFVDMLNDEVRYYRVRHCVKPGLTGWAQLRYPYGASVKDAEEKLKFDLFYVKNHGLVFDMMILLQTVEVVLFGRGAR
ncbi:MULTISPECIES: TIGR03013 family XrtA/PEP-CTERM system glycosyltransferase [Pseudoxanthomonas]|uniref:Sugar transferase n=1 Tax=Pseudoxanthomonas japonensis TaxID=69284 RepID=A0ABQ6ZD76_9GAMM|nr:MULTISPECIES: TIGR03013 family XrtA/PEP-CTERM system glycosyltransferase [Pseudoxanthomonas]KAF1722552.1 sugar transferase [Pseudoxanthomonas japonensis]MCR6626920.1 TIGR03013 family PEP-CTERM/XrtA system glycosyltransferase [Pseudoxanthomonas sp.]